MLIQFVFSMALLIASGSNMEINGDFVEAGAAYQEENDSSGEVRILSRFLEEALYSGQNRHAYNLILILELYPIDPGYFEYWYARLAWSCGISEFACRRLDSLNADQWLKTRAAGLASQFRGNAELAVQYYRESWTSARTSRERYYSALDLSFALLQTGDYSEAEMIASFLAENFPGEGIPLIALGLIHYEQNRFGPAMTVLQSVFTGETYTATARTFAGMLLEDLE
ncbi:MAG: hypothetical protein K8R76_07395 [Candidatus Aegiribacteria sp.]|nr:hypothetical protein [Candidatus Aegiribacteria sp.]